MSKPADESALLVRAHTIGARADRLAASASHPFTKDQLALVANAARDARNWLLEPGTLAAPDRARSVQASLEVQGKRLDDLEDLLRVHGESEGPLGLHR